MAFQYFINVKLFSDLREEDNSKRLWFGNTSGTFEEVKEGVPPAIINIPELGVMLVVTSLQLRPNLFLEVQARDCGRE